MTDPAHMGWTITDPVFQLREATQDTLFELSALPQVDAVIGSAHGSAICLRDPLVSRRHARLTRDGDGWVVHDLESTNGMWVDGMRRASAPLTPGTELRIGGILLVAESARFVALRQRASRILGWSVAQHDEVARALRALRVAASCRTSLILQGDGDLTPIVRQLHVEALGDERPFVVATAKNLRDALERAVGGTLCLPMRRDPAAISVAFEWSGTTSQIVVCVPDARAAGIAASVISSSTRIRIPSLSERRPELARIVAESAAEAATELAQPSTGLAARDLRSLEGWAYDGYADLIDSTYRLVALRTLGVTEGASRLGITHGALSRWARRREVKP